MPSPLLPPSSVYDPILNPLPDPLADPVILWLDTWSRVIDELEAEGYSFEGVDWKQIADEEKQRSQWAALLLLLSIGERVVQSAVKAGLPPMNSPANPPAPALTPPPSVENPRPGQPRVAPSNSPTNLPAPTVPPGQPRAPQGHELPTRPLAPDDIKAIVDEVVKGFAEGGEVSLSIDTNARMAHAYGDFESIKRDPNVVLLQYKTQEDDRVRPTHATRNNTVRPVGDSWWLRNWPPIEYRCRCFVRRITRAMAEALKLTVTNDPPELDDAPDGWLVDGVSPALRPDDALKNLVAKRLAAFGSGR